MKALVPKNPEKLAIASAGDIMELEFLLQQVDQPIPEFYTAAVVPITPVLTTQDDLKHKKNIFDRIKEIASPCTIRSLPTTVISKLWTVARLHLFHKITPVPKSVGFGDLLMSIRSSNIGITLNIHSIVTTILRNCDMDFLHESCNSEFTRRLVYMLRAPDPTEQASIEGLIQTLHERSSGQRQFIFKYLESLLEEYLNDCCEHYCVNPVLKIYGMYFKSKSLKTDADKQFLKYKIMPLFGKHYLFDFYKTLKSLCVLFYREDPNVAIDGLRTLMKYWPRCNTAKEVAFLDHLNVVISVFGERQKEEYAMIVFDIVTKALMSPNFKVAVIAMRMCTDKFFLCGFGSHTPEIIRMVAQALKGVKTTWNKDVQYVILNVHQLVAEIAVKCGIDLPEGPPSESEPVPDEWKTLSRFVV